MSQHSEGELCVKKGKKLFFDDKGEVPRIELDLIFENLKQFKEALGAYAVAKRFDFRANYRFVGKHFLSKLKILPNLKLKDMMRIANDELKVELNKNLCQRARVWANQKIRGRLEDEFNKLFDYVYTLREADPNGDFKGEILATVGRDGNNQIFPIAWVVVEGLLEEMQLILPNVEHRFCARHMYANWKKENSEHDMQQLFWACCKATTEAEFHKHSARMATLKDTALSSLLKRDPKHWSKAFFRTHSKCDAVDNNFGEAFNSTIISASKHGTLHPCNQQLLMSHNHLPLIPLNQQPLMSHNHLPLIPLNQQPVRLHNHSFLILGILQQKQKPGRPSQMLVRRPNTRSHATLSEPLIPSQPAPLSQQSESTHPAPVYQPAVMSTAPSTSTNHGNIIHKLLPRRRSS
ncbi:hypothetical protein V6N13_129510 [Hibiscus sabdariffa]